MPPPQEAVTGPRKLPHVFPDTKPVWGSTSGPGTLWTVSLKGLQSGEQQLSITVYSLDVQGAQGEGKPTVAGAEPPLRGNSKARAPSSSWSGLVDHIVRRKADDNLGKPWITLENPG